MPPQSKSVEPPHALYDLLLRLAPSELLLFDTELICQYAAPVEPAFFGLPREHLTGRHAAEIFPPAANGLRPVLERAATEAEPWHAPDYPFLFEIDSETTPYRWSVRVEPVAVEDYRGVLIILHDIRTWADTCDRVQTELDELRWRHEQQTRTIHDTQATLRNLLTPVTGYLQLMARRPEALSPRSPASILEEKVLPQLAAVVEAIDQLTNHPSTAQPDARYSETAGGGR